MSQYATLDDLTRLGLGASALTAIDNTTRTAALASRSAYADGFLAKRFTLPLSAWGDDLREAVVHMASWDLLSRRGFDPTAANDAAVQVNMERAERWLRDVAAGRVEPVGYVDATPTVADARSVVVASRPRRGW